jgi:hypothetical protein
MSLNGSGVFVVNSVGQPVVATTLIEATVFNAFTADVATALSTALYKDGQQTPTANIPMGGYRMTGMGAGILATDSANMSQLSNGAAVYVSTVGGTANAITLTPSPVISAYAAGQIFRFIVGTTNTGAVTIATSGLAVRNLKKRTSGGLVAVVANDLIAGCEYAIYDDGTQYILEGVRVYSQGADVASAGTVNLNTTTGDYVHITGTTAITAITLAQGEERTIVFDGILTFTHGASLILPGAASITTAANDIAVVRGEAAGVVRCVNYIKASGAAIVASNPFTIFDAAGDMVYASAADTAAKLSIGTAGQIQRVNAGATAPSWTAPTIQSAVITTTGAASVDSGEIIPSWATEVTITYSAVSTSGTSNLMVQIGDAGGIETSSYASTCFGNVTASNSTAGFVIANSVSAAANFTGILRLNLHNAAAFTWIASGTGHRDDLANPFTTSGVKSTSAAMTQIRLTMVGGADTFNAMSLTVSYR